MSLNYATRAIGQITGAPAPALTGTAISVATGQGARFINGAQERRARMYNVDTGAVEHITLTSRAADSFAIVRNIDGGGAQAVTPSAWVLEDIDDLGPWHYLAYDIGFFGATGGGAWNVDAADVLTHRWRRVGFTVEYEVIVSNSSITGVVNNLRIIIPTAATTVALGRAGPHPCIIFDASGTVAQLGYATVISGTNEVLVFKANGAAFTASANATIVSVRIAIEVP